MIDLSAFLLNRVFDIIQGLVAGFIISLIIAIFLFSAWESDERVIKILKIIIQITIILGLIIGFFLFTAELSTESLIDTFHGILPIAFLALIVTFFGLIIAFAYSLDIPEAEKIRKSLSKSFPSIRKKNISILPIAIFAGFLVFIFLGAIFEDFGILFIILMIIIFLGLLVAIGKILANRDFRRTFLKVIVSGKPIFLLGLFVIGSLIVILGYMSFIHASFFAPINQADYFNGFIETSTEDLFVQEIRDDQIRLVDLELAEAIVKRHTSLFGSNINARSIHITTYEGRLVWVAAMAPDNAFNQELSGLLIVDANDPTLEPIKVEFESGEAIISENLFYGAETRRVAWLSDKMSSYGRTYITWNDVDEIVQVQTFNNPQLFQWITYYGGVRIYDLKGQLIETYTEPLSIPSWVNQPFSEDWLEYNIENWGNLRSGNGFNIFASGFLGILTPSADRLEISQDTRYILSPDTNEVVAITPVHPGTNQLSNAGVFLTTNQKITFYDYRQRGYVSSESIEQYVESQEPPASQGEYYATLPMFYKVNVSSSETRMVYIVPVYHQTSTYNSDGDYYTYNVQFRGVYVLDALKQEVHGKAYLADYGANTASMVEAAKNNYLLSLANAGLGGDGPTNQTEDNLVTVNITQKASYVLDGDSYIAFKTNNSEYDIIIASPDKLDLDDWLIALFDVEVGTIVKFTAEKVDGIWFFTSLELA